MIGNKDNFFKAHYDWIALGVGILALVAGAALFAMSLGADADEEAAREVQRIQRMKPSETGVKSVNMDEMTAVMRVTKSPVLSADISEKGASFLASERRVQCSKCKKAIDGDIRACPNCPFCGEKQAEEKKIVLDADNDGMPDDWERKFGFNTNDASDAAKDFDGDGFTNLEECQAKTDPIDRKDHPDYLDSLKIQLPLKETKMPFVFRQANKIPAGWRLVFFDREAESAVDRRKKGAQVTAVIGEEVGKSGFIVKSYTAKTEKRERKGIAGKVEVDVSEVVVERKRDGKQITLVIQPKGFKPMAVDVQATLVYTRGEVKNFEVVAGQEIELNGTKYRINDIQNVGKGAKIIIEAAVGGKKSELSTLE